MNTIIIVSYALAFLGAASRLLPLTKPFWNLFPKVVQAVLPSLVAAIPLAIQQLTTVKTPMDLTAALLIIGALFLPGASSPHNHPDVSKPPSVPPLAAAGLFVICFVLGGCSLFASKLPAAEACAPTPASLAAQVADILAAGGDTNAALEQLALQDTESVVVCAVEAFLGNGKVGASVGDAAAKERARAYLKAKGVQ